MYTLWETKRNGKRTKNKQAPFAKDKYLATEKVSLGETRIPERSLYALKRSYRGFECVPWTGLLARMCALVFARRECGRPPMASLYVANFTSAPFSIDDYSTPFPFLKSPLQHSIYWMRCLCVVRGALSDIDPFHGFSLRLLYASKISRVLVRNLLSF